jgi:hypothetical protein
MGIARKSRNQSRVSRAKAQRRKGCNKEHCHLEPFGEAGKLPSETLDPRVFQTE